MDTDMSNYDVLRARGRVAAAATAVVKRFAVNYKVIADEMGVKPTAVRLPLTTNARDMDVTFAEFVAFVDELVGNVRETADPEAAEIVLREIQNIVVRGIS